MRSSPVLRTWREGERRERSPSSQLQSRKRAMKKKETPSTTATLVITCMKCAISRAIGVSPDCRPDARPAMRPTTVRSPVLITTPRAVPSEHILGAHSMCWVRIPYWVCVWCALGACVCVGRACVGQLRGGGGEVMHSLEGKNCHPLIASTC